MISKFNQFSHLKTDTLNKSFTTIDELFAKQEALNQRKRKSIFEGLNPEHFKRPRRDDEDKIVDEKLLEEPKIYENFVLKFNCKNCPDQFTKFGLFKHHLAFVHKQDEIISKTKFIDSDGDNHDGHQNVLNKHCRKCRKYSINPNFKKPFSPKLHRSLLVELNVNFFETVGYATIDRKLPSVRPRNILKLASEDFIVGELKGEGGFAKVYSASWTNGPQGFQDVVLKVQKPSNDWEWYLLKEVHSRLEDFEHPELGPGVNWSDSFMPGTRCITYQDGSIIVSPCNKLGTILDLVNDVNKVDKSIVEPLAVYVVAELLGVVEMLHSLDFIHGDLKPDNLMLTDLPGGFNERCIQVIDFGKAIDLRCMPKNICFDEFVKTSGLITVEMREEKPYRHHIDYFGIVAVAYCLLFGQYIDIKKSGGRWMLKTSLKRWWSTDFWREFFDEFLNLDGLDRRCLPSLMIWREKFLDLYQKDNMRTGLEKARNVLMRKSKSNRRRTM